jgi:hypothetical protein
MNETELKKLWDKLQGKLNVGTFESFKSKMSTPEQRKKFFDKYYQQLKDSYNFNLGNYTDFENRLKGATQPAPVTPSWTNYPCVTQLAASKNVRISANGAYTIDGVLYFDNGRKYTTSTRQMGNYSCNDPEFQTATTNNTQTNNTQTNNTQTNNTQRNSLTGYYIPCPETLPIKRFCKNKTIKKIQSCIGVLPDGKFGPLTQEALEALDLPGTRITADSLAKACGQSVQNVQGGQNVQSTQDGSQTTQGGEQNVQTTKVDKTNLKSADYYSDYQTDEEENELTNSNPYGDYDAVEGDEETIKTNFPSVDSPVTPQTPPVSGQPLDLELTPKQKARNAYMYGQPNK